MDGRAPPKKTLGVLGGMGPAATHRLFGQLIQLTSAASDQDHLRILIDNNTAIPDRTAFLLGQGESPVPQLVASARRLEQAGADLIVMPCNTASVFLPEIRSVVAVPVVDWVATAVECAVARTSQPVGLLATTGTVTSGIYQRTLADRGRDVVLPTDAEQDELMEVIYGRDGIKAGRLAHHARVTALVNRLVGRDAGAVILGCSELPLALDRQGPLPPVPMVDPSEAAARTAIVQSGASLRDPCPMETA